MAGRRPEGKIYTYMLASGLEHWRSGGALHEKRMKGTTKTHTIFRLPKRRYGTPCPCPMLLNSAVFPGGRRVSGEGVEGKRFFIHSQCARERPRDAHLKGDQRGCGRGNFERT